MNETSLEEVVKQLDRVVEPETREDLSGAGDVSSASAILDGLRSNDRLLAEVCGRYRQLQDERCRLVERLRRLENQGSETDGTEGPTALAV